MFFLLCEYLTLDKYLLNILNIYLIIKDINSLIGSILGL